MRLLLERERDLATLDRTLDEQGTGGSGATVLIDGPAGIGKTALLDALGERASERGFTVLRARGSEMERDFGFGVVRQLFAPLLRALGAEERSRLLSGPAALAAAIFGMAGAAPIDPGAAEASLYGLYWFLAALAERGPLVLAIDDAHWSDTASLRFIRYLGQRLDGLPVIVALAARPNEPGVQAEMVRGLSADLDPVVVRPSLLTQSGTAALVRARVGEGSGELEAACHEATGGNPFLVEELLAELDSASSDDGAVAAKAVATIGPERIAASVLERAGRLDPAGAAVAEAVAVLGDGADLRAIAALARIEPGRAARIADGLAAASILADGQPHRFAHPLLRGAVYEAIPAANRSLSHGRAATVLAEHGAEPETIAAHLLLCEPGTTADAAEVLSAAAERASERGAGDSAATYLRRALEEVGDGPERGQLLHRLGSIEVVQRDPAAIEHLGEGAALTTDPQQALEISFEMIELLFIAGQWDAAVAAIDSAMERFGQTGLPGLLEIEALRAAGRGYDRVLVAEYERDLPRLLSLVEGRTDEESSRLRWVLAGLCALRGEPRELVLDLLDPISTDWVVGDRGRESSLTSHAVFALLLVEALDDGERLAAALLADGRRRGSLLTIVAGLGFQAPLEQRRGSLSSSEANLTTAIELLRENELSLMALTTALNFCLDTILERLALQPVAEMVASLEVPPPLVHTFWGGMGFEVRAAVRAMRGDREGALADLRETEAIFRPLRISPRFSPWRSRLALALAEESGAQPLELASEELELARAVGSPRAEGVALRTLGMLRGGDAKIESLRDSVAVLRDSIAQLELARSLAELGAALRRANQRSEARERLREAADLAQRCGAERLEARVQEELRVAGAKPRRRAISGVDALTASERRVAAAAAGGASNREIAQELFVSMRTVEMHLTNAYRKLGISSRTELGAMLEERP